MISFVHRILGRSDIYFAGSLYMRRWRIIDLLWFGLRVHHIARSDADCELHDHPFTFVSIILTGGYYEHTIDGRRTWYGPGSVVVRSADNLHRLELLKDLDAGGPCIDRERSAWTLVVRGPRRREWGFLTDRGWQHWQAFTDERRTGTDQNGQPFAAESSL